MPQAVAERVHAAAVAGSEELAAFVHVRDVGEGLVAESAFLHDGRTGFHVQCTIEALRERELLVVGERLVAEHEHRVLVHPGPDPVQRAAIGDAAQIDRGHLGGEVRVKLAERQGHRAPSGSPNSVIWPPARRSRPHFSILHSPGNERLGVTETRNIIGEVTHRIFRDLGDPQTLNSTADERWRAPLWRALEDSALTQAWVPEALNGAGAPIADGFE